MTRPSKMHYFMNIAEAVAQGSTDPKTQVGAVLVDNKNRIIGTGYNGAPAGFDDSKMPWDSREDCYPRIVHAEMNAILYSGARFDERAKLYCTMSPCKDCIKLVAAAGIKTVYFKTRYKDYDTTSQLATEFGLTLIQTETQG